MLVYVGPGSHSRHFLLSKTFKKKKKLAEKIPKPLEIYIYILFKQEFEIML